jgi:hypothetical protein
MQVEFPFDAAAIRALHSRPHVQASYGADGTCEVTIGDTIAVLGAGAVFIAPPTSCMPSRPSPPDDWLIASRRSRMTSSSC